MKSLSKQEQGFTLIEIVIVLAIAAAIMLMVFLAVTGARASQRDTQRRSDVSRMAATMESYASSNSGTYPASSLAAENAWWSGYISGSFTAPGGGAYTNGDAGALVTAVPTTLTKDTVDLIPGATATAYTLCVGPDNSKAPICVSSN